MRQTLNFAIAIFFSFGCTVLVGCSPQCDEPAPAECTVDADCGEGTCPASTCEDDDTESCTVDADCTTGLCSTQFCEFPDGSCSQA